MTALTLPKRDARTRPRGLLAIATAVSLAIVASFVGGPAAGAASEADSAMPRTIDVTGTGIVRGTPDVLDLVLGIEVRARSAAEALSRNSELLRKVLVRLRDANVAEDDTQTAELSVWPVTNDDGTAVIAYSVSNTLDVTLRDLDTAGSVVDAVTQIAGDEIVVRGLSFSFEDNSRLVARARAEAVRQARVQAEQLAQAGDVTLGRLLSIEETSTPEGTPLPLADAKSTAEASAPIEPGTLGLSVEVHLRYEIA